MSSVAQFDIQYTQFLNDQCQVSGDLPPIATDKQKLIELYKAMVVTRVFDKKAIALQRTGQLGTYPSSLGQEAISVAMGSTMQQEDILFPYYREYGAQFLRGVSMKEIYLYWGGDERGMDYAKQKNDFPICVPIASHAPQAVGAAYAFKLRNEPRVAVFICGDGATSKGDFYEAINAAGVWGLPVVFVVNNNQWAISVPRSKQTACETIAQKAVAAGISGEQVDGNDIIALHHRIGKALEKARTGGGPSVIEALTYRLCDHTTADDASRYRSEEEVNRFWQIEPIARLKKYLTDLGEWNEAKEDALLQECTAQVEQAVQAYLDTPPQAPESMFEHMFEKMPSDLQQQYQELKGGGN